MDDDTTLVAYLHNGFNVGVKGNAASIDVLVDLLVPNTLVKGIAVYSGEPLAKTRAMNYTQLKAARS